MMRNGWELAIMALMTDLGSRLFATFRRRRLFIDRNHAGGCRGFHLRLAAGGLSG